MKFRIKHVEGIGYFAQRRRFFVWHTIGRHPDGYGLYSQTDLDYPLGTYDEAVNRCRNYEQWEKRRSHANREYYDLG